MNYRVASFSLYIMAIAMSLFALSCNDKAGKYYAKEGTLDISQESIENIKSTDIAGEWEFYWNKLISPSEFKNFEHNPEYIKVPREWNRKIANNSKISPTGFATYRLVINTNEQDSVFGIVVNRINTAYKLWVNGKLVSSSGVVAKTYKAHKHSWLGDSEVIRSENQKIEIVIQVSNFSYKYGGGIIDPLELTSKAYIDKSSKTKNGIQFILYGLLILTAFYHLVLYLSNKNLSSLLPLSILSIAVGLLIVVYKDCDLLYVVFPNMTWGINFKLYVIFFTLSLLMLFVHLFPAGRIVFPKIPTKLIYAFFILVIVLAIIIPAGLLTFIYSYAKWGFLLIVIYLTYMVFKSLVNKKIEAKATLLGMITLLIALVYDFIINRYQLGIMELTPFSLTFYIFIQVYLVSTNFVESISYSEQLTEEMDFINNNLEKLVKDRTSEVEHQKEKLRIQSENLQTANDQIVTVNEVLKKQGEEISKKNRALTDSLNYAKRLQSAVLPDREYLNQVLPEHFIFYQPKDIVSGDFYWYGEVDSSWDFDDSNNAQVLVVADCTGHGVPGAFMTLLGHNFLNLTVNVQQVTDPEQIIYKIDQQVVETLKQKDPASIKDGMDISVLTIEQEKNMISFSGAGNPLYYFSQGEFHEVKGSSFGVGGILRKEKRFIPHKIEYKSGDIFYIFSDGYHDQIGGDEGRKFYKKRLKELLEEIHTYTVEEQEKIIRENFYDWKGDHKQIDDVLIIGIRMP